ncbi:hypothetical protein JCM8097_003740 [Rhodosporidiobolus ruineniae]
MTTILILGGLGQDATRHLLPYLTSPTSSCPPDFRPAFVRVVDKYLAIPSAGAYTTYVDTAAREALKKGAEDGTVEYLQGNLLTEATREKAFTLPEKYGGAEKGFSFVFDFTGETDFEAPEIVHIERTVRLALLLGRDAVKHKAGAYLRTLQPFYKLKDEKKGAKVGTPGAGDAEPWGTLAGWWHEAARGLAKLEGLNLVLLRPALFYGPYTVTGMTPRCLIAEVYKFQNEKMEFLWAESLAQNTIHAADFAAACLSAVSWAAKLGTRSAILGAHSESLPSTLSSDAQLSALTSANLDPAKKSDSVRAAVFNAVDDGETTQKEIARIVEEVVGVKSGFHGSIISSFAKMNMSDVVEDVNDKHLEGWSALLQASQPPISPSTPISPSIPLDLLAPNPLSFDNSALKRLTGWAPKERLNRETVRETVEKFRTEGHWPNAKPQKKK